MRLMHQSARGAVLATARHTVAHATTLSKIYTIVQTERDDYANTNSNNSCYNIDSERQTKTEVRKMLTPKILISREAAEAALKERGMDE